MKIGEFELHSIITGAFRLDGGAMFGVVPKVLWEKTNPADQNNRIEMVTRSLLLLSKNCNILIDTGIGDYHADKFNKIYAFEGGISWDKTLSELNIKREDITDIIISHLHFDHAGGLVTRSGGELALTFPDASIHVQRSNLYWARSGNTREKGSYLNDYLDVIEASENLNLIDDDAELYDGVSLIQTTGHTTGHQIVHISDNDNSLFYCADLIPLASHVRTPFVMAYDLNPVQTIEEKGHYLDIAASHHCILFFEHDPKIAAATVKYGEKDFEIDKEILL